MYFQCSSCTEQSDSHLLYLRTSKTHWNNSCVLCLLRFHRGAGASLIEHLLSLKQHTFWISENLSTLCTSGLCNSSGQPRNRTPHRQPRERLGPKRPPWPKTPPTSSLAQPKPRTCRRRRRRRSRRSRPGPPPRPWKPPPSAPAASPAPALPVRVPGGQAAHPAAFKPRHGLKKKPHTQTGPATSSTSRSHVVSTPW